MSTKVFRTWSERLDSGTLTKFQIRQFAAAISRVAMGEHAHGHRCALTPDERQSLYGRIHRNPVLLTREHTDQGYTWLVNHGCKALSMDELTHAVIVRDFDHFSWNGEIRTFGHGSSLPIWTIHLRNGDTVQYYNASWVSDPSHVARAWWFGMGEPEPVPTDDYSLSDDAARVAALADSAINDWNRLVRDTKKRTERLRSTKR